MASYGIMRCEKRGASAIGGLEAENNRIDPINLPASDVDWDQTDKNEYLIKSDDWRESIKEELSKHGIEKYRKDAVLMIDTLYTASPDFFKDKSPEEVKAYFEDCLAFHDKEFGHIFNAVIHLDEATPHMHVVSVPIVDRGDHFALSAKELMGTRTKYHERQDRFYEEVSSKWDLDRGEIRDPATRREHLDTLDFKIEKRSEELSDTEKDLIEIKAKTSEILDIHEELSADIDTLKEQYENAKDTLDEIHTDITAAKEELSSLEKIKSLVTDIVAIFKDKIENIISKAEALIEKIESGAEVRKKDLADSGIKIQYHKEHSGVICATEDQKPLTWNGYEVTMVDTSSEYCRADSAFNLWAEPDNMIIMRRDLPELLQPYNRDFDVSQLPDIDALERGIENCHDVENEIAGIERSYDDVEDDFDDIDYGVSID